jgi:hypothetical protein
MITRRSMIAFGGAAAASVGAGYLAVDAKKKNKRKTVTKTFSNKASISLPDDGKATPYPVPIKVSGLKKGKILKVRVLLNGFTHLVPDNVDVLLAASQLPGLNAVIMSDVGGAFAVNGVNLILDDEAATPLPDNAQLTNGTYKPANYSGTADAYEPPAPTPSGNSLLSVFNGQNPNGEWQLWIDDWIGNGPGSFSGGWSIEITAQVKKKKKKKK